MSTAEIPLFPLNTVLFPGGPPPLEDGGPEGATLTPDIPVVGALRAGDYYVNVPPADVPSGAIRCGSSSPATPTWSAAACASRARSASC